jgi:hypothetical protein
VLLAGVLAGCGKEPTSIETTLWSKQSSALAAELSSSTMKACASGGANAGIVMMPGVQHATAVYVKKAATLDASDSKYKSFKQDEHDCYLAAKDLTALHACKLTHPFFVQTRTDLDALKSELDALNCAH